MIHTIKFNQISDRDYETEDPVEEVLKEYGTVFDNFQDNNSFTRVNGIRYVEAISLWEARGGGTLIYKKNVNPITNTSEVGRFNAEVQLSGFNQDNAKLLEIIQKLTSIGGAMQNIEALAVKA